MSLSRLEIFDPQATWKRKTFTNFTAKVLQVPVFQGGKLVYESPSLQEIQTYCAQQLETLWDEVKRARIPIRITWISARSCGTSSSLFCVKTVRIPERMDRSRLKGGTGLLQNRNCGWQWGPL